MMKNPTSIFLLLVLSALVLINACDSKKSSTKDTTGKSPTSAVNSENIDKKSAGPDDKTVAGQDEKTEDPKPLEEKKPAAPGKDEKEFIPKGWKIEDKKTGDLNGDSRPDSVLQIKNENAGNDDEFDRSLIILFKTEDGKYAKAAEGKKVIRCSSCGGMLGGGPADVKIAKGVVTVSQLYGSREGTDYLHRFRYEKATKKFLMIGEDVRNFDRGTGKADSTSTNYLTGKQIITREERTEDGEDLKETKETKTVAKTKKYLEDVSYNSY